MVSRLLTFGVVPVWHPSGSISGDGAWVFIVLDWDFGRFHGHWTSVFSMFFLYMDVGQNGRPRGPQMLV